MIVPILGNVTYKITLDPTVWIFDDRKVLFEEAFLDEKEKDNTKEEELKQASERWDRAVYQQKINPPINQSISRFEREKILVNSYVMPIKDFVEYAESGNDATDVTLKTKHGDVEITLDQLLNCYLLFAIDGKPVKTDGPVHLFFKDGSNKDNPITGIEKIIIN
ncbi:hypothetical protein [Virgibacillus siamensis]|uniref:hypothetical protein n=1 Tax=Virgibacillus siamensis TaxID=480071 RepID=UPI00098672A0|nr:hypothetical protein [Virgibacillus siamensis]